jgi:hypothetical protein
VTCTSLLELLGFFKEFKATQYGIMGSISQDAHFKKIQNFEADYADAKFTQYESQRTGLRVTVVDRKGPKVYGYFAVATEIHDDSGSRKSCLHISVTVLMALSAYS